MASRDEPVHQRANTSVYAIWRKVETGSHRLMYITFKGIPTDAQFDDFLPAFREAVFDDSEDQFGLMIDVSRLSSAPRSVQSKMVRFMRDHHSDFKRRCVQTVILTNSRLVRAFLKAVFMIKKPASPVEMTGDVDHAIVRFGARDVTIPEEQDLRDMGFHRPMEQTLEADEDFDEEA